jgi:hypothetical protein
MNREDKSKHLHKLPAVSKSTIVNLSDTLINTQTKSASQIDILTRLFREQQTIREREKQGKMIHKSSDNYL